MSARDCYHVDFFYFFDSISIVFVAVSFFDGFGGMPRVQSA